MARLGRSYESSEPAGVGARLLTLGGIELLLTLGHLPNPASSESVPSWAWARGRVPADWAWPRVPCQAEAEGVHARPRLRDGCSELLGLARWERWPTHAASMRTTASFWAVRFSRSDFECFALSLLDAMERPPRAPSNDSMGLDLSGCVEFNMSFVLS